MSPARNPAPATEIPTSDRILDVAERLVQLQGFNGFSYADIAGELEITKASLHYHFATKAKLGARLIERYGERFFAALNGIDGRERDARRRLRAYVRLYEDVLRSERMCLCGMLAAETKTLPPEMRTRVTSFFDANEAWLAQTLERGRKDKQLHFTGAATEHARLLLGALEGAMLVARTYGEVARFTAVATRLLRSFEVRA